MTKKFLFFLIVVSLIFTLAACSAQQSSGSQSQGQSTTQQQNQAGSPPAQSVEDKLGVGTLKLEGTDKAVTAAQAKTLLPLWKAVKSLSTSSSTSTAELTALYQQIEEGMTADQVQAIKNLNLSPTDLQALMTQYGIQAPQGIPAAQRTPSAQNGSASSGSVQQNGGLPPDLGAGGGMPPDGGVGGVTGGQPAAQSTPQGTPRAGQTGGMRGGMNYMLADAVIKLLEQRAGV